ncbi:MAG: TetR family transcriptional [Geobacteraceae bacterium]|nr:MAG: TetR family transcriptional [Geobacteraceae bacterium]
MPPKTEFSRDAILAAGIKVVREQGWEQLSARSIAGELRSSTRPVYTGFSSMQELKDLIGRQVYEMLLDYQFRPITGHPFLDMGVGYVLFARDEPSLFRLFYLPHIISFDLEQELRDKVNARLLGQMKEEPEAPKLSDEGAASLLLRLKIFTHGLACYIAAGKYEFGVEEIVSLISAAGRAFFLDEMQGSGEKCEASDSVYCRNNNPGDTHE